MWMALEFTATITECFIITDFMTKFLGFKDGKCNIFKIILCVALLVLNEAFTSEQFHEHLKIALLVLICFAYCYIYLKGSLWGKMFVSLIPCTLMVMISTSVLVLFQRAVGLNFEDLIQTQGVYRLMILFITKFLLFLATRILISVNGKNKYPLSKAEWLTILTIFSATLIIGISTFDAILHQEYGNIFAMVSIFGLIVINIISFYLLIKISRDNQEKLKMALLELQVKEQEKSMLKINDQYTEILKIRHDMKNYINCGLTLLKQGEYDEAELYLSKISYDKLGTVIQYVTTPSNIVNAVLNSKLSLANESGITVHCNISGSVEKISDIDLSILLSNLLDNAIEACKKNKIASSMDCKITNSKGYLYIVLKNTIENSVLSVNPNLRTSKTDKSKHGLGLQTVTDIVKKYDGMINISEENGDFVTDILLKVN